MALRDLLETAMFREEKAFGSKSVVANTVVTAKDWQQEDLLMHMNQKHVSNPMGRVEVMEICNRSVEKRRDSNLSLG